jgi:2-polyprenyl-3-methyl-5-hydroxy-6-metoxy-1,4-benzoquinol methylase
LSGYDFEGRRAHAYNKLNWHVPQAVRGRLLDIGCGPGNGVVAALQCGFSMAVGVDQNLNEFIGLTHSIKERCAEYDVNVNDMLLIQGDIFDLSFPPDTFDCVLMLDSIEHVPNPRKFIEFSSKYLRRGGVMVIDTCPLYYSKLGHHLFSYFPADTYPWAHLRYDFASLVQEASVDDWSMKQFKELNKVTNQQIRKDMEDCNFKILEEVRSRPNDDDQKLLDRHRNALNIDHIDHGLLFEDWILLVGERL